MRRLIGFRATSARIGEYRITESKLLTLLTFGRVVGIAVDVQVDDNITLSVRVKVRQRRKKPQTKL